MKLLKPLYEIEIVIYTDEKSDPLEVTISGVNYESLKSDIMPTVKRLCNAEGYTKGEILVDMTVSKDGEYFDCDSETFELSEL